MTSVKTLEERLHSLEKKVNRIILLAVAIFGTQIKTLFFSEFQIIVEVKNFFSSFLA